ncbi:hypothetical protein KP509_28G014200 [Ceratopteris richardii]|uniref:Glycosyltransferase n=1 Tax=Ceratopteris richardii TaxID=49495 RepID=A0A8T2RBK1_CERRI|nr:hypothetical protein KP509_28G014200 [Ceratopteris richardii]
MPAACCHCYGRGGREHCVFIYGARPFVFLYMPPRRRSYSLCSKSRKEVLHSLDCLLDSVSCKLLISHGSRQRPPSSCRLRIHSVCADELAVIEGIPGVPSHTVSRAPAISRRDIVGDFVFDFITKPFLHIHGALAVLINTMSCIEAEALNALRSQRLNVLPVGPLLPSSCCGSSESTCSSEKSAGIMTREKHPCLSWLETQEPGSVLYISFGTLVCLEETTFTELALGIEASGLSFLWSLRSDMVAGNHGLFLEAFKERTNHKGKIWPWVPQLEVLSHSSIGGFLTHCGWNSSLESMCRGVPMIGMPIFGEQKLNLLCLEDRWNVCVAMEAENICRSKVQRTVSAFFEGAVVQKLRGNAEKVRDAATAAMAMDGSSSVNIMRALQLTSGGGLDDNIANGRDSRSKQGSWN